MCHQVPEYIIKWYEQLLKHRLIKATVKDEIRYLRPTKGSPQGGVLSPTLWNLQMDSILSSHHGWTSLHGFADDLIITCEGTNLLEMGRSMQERIEQVLSWGTAHGLQFSAPKTQAIVFHNRRGKGCKFTKPKIYMNGEEIEYSENVKYLGIWLNQRLSWTHHIKQVQQKAIKATMTLSRMAKSIWGMRPEVAWWTYTSMVRPILLYGAIVWAPKLTKGQIKLLTKVQHLNLSLITGCFRTTPADGLNTIMGIPPIDLIALQVALNTASRIYGENLRDLPANGTGHLNKVRDELDSTELNLQQPEETHPMIWENLERQDYEGYQEGLNCYTDGSKTEQGVAFVWCITSGKYVMDTGGGRLRDENSVYQAEMYALLRLSQALIDRSRYKELVDTHVFSDSLSAIQVLMDVNLPDELAYRTKNNWLEIKRYYAPKVTLGWVRGHNDNTGNELADVLAKGYTSGQMIDTQVPTPRSWSKKVTKAHIWKKWKSRYIGLQGLRQTKANIGTPIPGLHGITKKLSRLQLKTLTCLITGHGAVLKHLERMGLTEDTTCRICDISTEDTLHWLQDCPALFRTRYYLDFNHMTLDDTFTKQDLVAYISSLLTLAESSQIRGICDGSIIY